MIEGFTKTAGKLWENNQKGNFGLWFNKYIPLNDNFKPCDRRGDHTKDKSYYALEYGKKSFSSKRLLEEKLNLQADFIESKKKRYTVLEFSINLKTPLVLGMGESHPSENGMTLDHTLGIPYIPASSIKGVLRFHFTVNLIHELERAGILEEFTVTCRDGGDCLDEPKTAIPGIFGGNVSDENGRLQENAGNIIVLDAYSLTIPVLQVDIMNNHHTKYYNSSDRIPPSDTEEPNPVQFISIKPGVEFRFYILLDKKIEHHSLALIDACKEMFMSGIGAKTAVGYGRFDWDEYSQRSRKAAEEKEKREKQLQLEAEELEKKAQAEKERLRLLKEQQEKKEREKEEAEQKRLAHVQEKEVQENKSRKEALVKGIEGFRNVTNFKDLKGLSYIYIANKNQSLYN